MKSLLTLAAPLRVAALALLLLSASPSFLHLPALGQATPRPPEWMSYQGFLVDADGDSLGAPDPKNYDVIFRIYAAETGGDPLWAEQQTITVDQGHFSVLLGEGAPIGTRPPLSTLFKGPDASERHVEITVKGLGPGGTDATILPRLRLLSSPYAFLAEQATKLVRTDTGADLLTSSDNTVTATGSIAATGSITAASFSGSGADLTGVAKPSDLTGLARLSGGNTFIGDQTADGHLRLGGLGVGGTAGYGKALILSGAPGADNTDPLWLARYNVSSDSTELRINLGDNPGSAADRLVIGTTSGGDFNQTGTWTPQLTLDARGFLGIGTQNPGARLEVNGGIRARGGAPGPTGVSNNGYAFSGNGGDNDSGMFSEADGQLNFYANANKTFAVLNHITPSSNVGYVEIYHPTDKSRTVRIYRGPGAADPAGASHLQNGLVLELRGPHNHTGSHGAVRRVMYNGDDNWDFESDRKLKKDIVEAEPMLNRALQVAVRRYRWNDDGDEAKHKLGVIAQELQPLFPEMVGKFQDPDTGETNLTVSYGNFALIALKALQEFTTQHDAETTELKAQVAELQAQNQAQAERQAVQRQELDALHERLASLEKHLRQTAGGSAAPAALAADRVLAEATR